MVSSNIDIANRALQKVGARRIGSFDEGSREANEVNACFFQLRDAELRTNFRTFATKRVQLAALTTSPAFGRTKQYQLPEDFLRLAARDPDLVETRNDYLIEGRKLLTDDPGPIDIRYISTDVPPEEYDPLFVEALAARVAMEIAEELTQSNSKKDNLERAYQFHISQARRSNSIEAGPIQSEEDPWISVRRGSGNGGYDS